VAALAQCQPVVPVARIVSVTAVLQRALEEARSAAEMEVPRARAAAEEAKAWVVAASAVAVNGAALAGAGNKQPLTEKK
jgi:hypothetical protein